MWLHLCEGSGEGSTETDVRMVADRKERPGVFSRMSFCHACAKGSGGVLGGGGGLRPRSSLLRWDYGGDAACVLLAQLRGGARTGSVSTGRSLVTL